VVEQRPTKKQRELLSFIDGFIKGNGYGPSYREIMRALDYKSVSTVAVHVNGLIARGFLLKKDNSARTLEVIGVASHVKVEVSQHETWLQKEIAKRQDTTAGKAKNDEAKILLKAAHILGFNDIETPGK
jgi:SOS-response transcriptional repressor LexA